MGAARSSTSKVELTTTITPTSKSPKTTKQSKSTNRLSEISRRSEGRDSFEKFSEAKAGYQTKPRKSLKEVLGSRNGKKTLARGFA